MPFGLIDAPRAIYIVLSSVRWNFAILYLDDIILFSKTIDDRMAHLKAVLTLLKDVDLALNLLKYFFLQSSVEYLGQIWAHAACISLRKHETPFKLCKPKKRYAAQILLGYCNSYHWFVSNFAQIASPTNQQTS